MVEETQIPESYRKTEVGIIPNDWKLSSVGDEFDVKLGKMLDSEKNVGIPKFYIGNKSVQWNRIDVTDLSQILMRKNELERFRLRFGDLLVCEGGEVGRAAIWKNQIEECYFQKALHRLRPKKGFNTQIMLALFHYWAIHNKLSEYVSQTSIAHLTREKISIIPLAVPPETEQTAIATVLNDADALITRLEKLIAKKRAVKQGAMQELFKPKDDCEELTIGDVAEVKDGTHQTPKYVKQGIPFYSVENITANDFINTKFISRKEHSFLTKNWKIEKGDVLMTRIGSIGVCKYIDWEVDASFYVSLALLKINKEFDAKFISHYSNYSFFKREIELNSLQFAYPQKINLGQISKVKLIIPKSKTEQSRIAQILSDLDTEITVSEKKLKKYKQIKIGMMQNLLTGKIRLV